MNKFLLTVISLTVLFICCLSLAQDIYVYPNKKLADQGLIEYRRYTLEEARAYQQGGSFEPYLTIGWSTERQLTNDLDAYGPKVITSGDSIYCSYFTIGPRLPYFIRSINSGMDWQGYTRLADSDGTKVYYYPEFGKYNGNLIIGLCIYEFEAQGFYLGYFKSTDSGNNWSSLNRVFGYARANSSNYSSLCNVNQRVYFSYNEYDHDSIYVVRSTNYGTSWNDRGIPVAYLSGTPQPMTIRASDSTIHLVWVNEILPVSVRYSRSTDTGQTWSPEIDIAQDPYGSQRCYFSVEGQHVVVSWMGYKYSPYTFTGDMFIRQSYDGGAIWDSAQVITDSHYVWMGSNYIKDSLIVITWQDDRYRSQNYNSEIYVKYSTDYGATWSQETRLSYGDDDSDSPMASSTNGIIHILWGDRRPEASGLYYSSNNLYDDIDNEMIPLRYSQLSSYPNPFNSSTIIKYPANEGGEIGIYNLLGQQVKALRISLNGGQVVWDGTDDNRISVPSGVYFARVKSSGSAAGQSYFFCDNLILSESAFGGGFGPGDTAR